jgi:hypothetical protein
MNERVNAAWDTPSTASSTIAIVASLILPLERVESMHYLRLGSLLNLAEILLEKAKYAL